MSDQNILNRQIIRGILDTSNLLLKQANGFFKDYGLTAIQYNVLLILSESPQPLAQMDIAEKLVVSRSDITGVIDRLEKNALVIRKVSAQDRRHKMISLSDAGKTLQKRVQKKYLLKIESLLQNLNQKEKKQFLDLQTKIQKQL